MSDLEFFLGVFTGLGFLHPGLPLETLVPTAIAVNLFDAITCRIFAANQGFPKNLWTGLGFVFGLWAMVTLLLLRGRGRAGADAT